MGETRLRADAPLLDAWLTFTERTAAGAVRPFTIPGHKQRRDLVGDVVAGDVPLYAGLDTMKLTRGVLADAEQRAARWNGTILIAVCPADRVERLPGAADARGDTSAGARPTDLR